MKKKHGVSYSQPSSAPSGMASSLRSARTPSLKLPAKEPISECEVCICVEGGTPLPSAMHHRHSASEMRPRCSSTAGRRAASRASVSTIRSESESVKKHAARMTVSSAYGAGDLTAETPPPPVSRASACSQQWV